MLHTTLSADNGFAITAVSCNVPPALDTVLVSETIEIWFSYSESSYSSSALYNIAVSSSEISVTISGFANTFNVIAQIKHAAIKIIFFNNHSSLYKCFAKIPFPI